MYSSFLVGPPAFLSSSLHYAGRSSLPLPWVWPLLASLPTLCSLAPAWARRAELVLQQ